MPTRILTTLAIVLGLASGAAAQAPYVPYLVKDIEPGPGSSYAYPVGSVDDRVFFTSRWSSIRYELWTSTGTEPSTQLVLAAPAAATPAPFLSLGGEFYFAYFGAGAFKSDGTPAGT